MSARLRSSSGTYYVRQSELIHSKTEPPIKAVQCVVQLLDDTSQTLEIDRRAKAQVLLDLVFDHLDLIEKDYFGLQYQDENDGPNERMRWVDPLKSLKRQIKGEPPYQLYFRVKFYITDPSRLHEEYTRYHFFLQIKRDIYDGKLFCPRSVATLLASYAVQSELGDYSPDEHRPGYLSSLKLCPNQDQPFESEVIRYHQQHKGQTPADAEYNYLDRAKHLEMYGVDLHEAKDSNGVDIQLGVTATGLVVFQDKRKVDQFTWARIIKISFKRKQFFIQVRSESAGESDSILVFNMFTYRSCKSLWKACVEYHSFFRLHHIKQSPRRWYQLGSKFRYSGRTEYEAQQDSKRLTRADRPFQRTGSKTLRHTIGGSSNTTRPIDFKAGYSPSNTLNNSFPTKSSLRSSYTTRSRTSLASDRVSNWNGSYLTGTNGKLEDEVQGHSSNQHASLVKRDSLTSREHMAINNVSSRDLTASLPRSLSNMENNGTRGHADVALSRPLTAMDTNLPRSHNNISANLPRSSSNIDALGRGSTNVPEPSSTSLPRGATMNGGATYNLNNYKQTALDYSDIPNDNGFLDNHSLVTIRMKPDEQGRFGFNVKGGMDQGMPVIVSRVAAGMPADLCMPKLNEGDQVLLINGRDVTQHTHEQVVMFIRAARETHSGDLVLVVRPNVYVGEDYKEPEFHYVPETHRITAGMSGLDLLSESLMLLREGVESGAAIAQFEQLYRRKPGLTNQCAKIAENLAKNRYRDISPYDQTRVMLRDLPTGDYINANFINMEIPGSGIVNRYIAAQGPLPNTCSDFWEMIWQQHITLVVMLTALIERGRIKCHQYWPHLYETTDFGTLQLTCLKEKETRSFAFREFTLVNVETNEERHIHQMQYIAWPDHGCPDDSSDFLDFVIRVRQKRIGMVEPTLVHCSAGIGRTGVMILMETAMCLVEANQPVYPLDIVRQMRDQRAMLIQTSSQYKFVCEAILRVFHEGLVKPLDDFRH